MSAPSNLEHLFGHIIARKDFSDAFLKGCVNDEFLVPNVPRRILEHLRNGASDEELWMAWRIFVRDVGSPVWLTGVDGRPELDGVPASIKSFDADSGRISVRIGDGGEVLLLPGKMLSWHPLDVADGCEVNDVASLLEKVIDTGAVEKVCAQLTCTRCDLPCERGAMCTVPHAGWGWMEIGGDMTVFNADVPALYACEACGERLWKTEVSSATSAFESARPCWVGKHTTAVVLKADLRVSVGRHPDLGNNEETDRYARNIRDREERAKFLLSPKCTQCRLRARGEGQERCYMCVRMELFKKDFIERHFARLAGEEEQE